MKRIILMIAVGSLVAAGCTTEGDSLVTETGGGDVSTTVSDTSTTTPTTTTASDTSTTTRRDRGG